MYLLNTFPIRHSQLFYRLTLSQLMCTHHHNFLHNICTVYSLCNTCQTLPNFHNNHQYINHALLRIHPNLLCDIFYRRRKDNLHRKICNIGKEAHMRNNKVKEEPIIQIISQCIILRILASSPNHAFWDLLLQNLDNLHHRMNKVCMSRTYLFATISYKHQELFDDNRLEFSIKKFMRFYLYLFLGYQYLDV